MRELSKPDILSPMPGQVTGRWSSRLSPILSDDLHFAARPRVSLNVTVDGGGRGKEKKKGKSYRIPKTRGRILFGSETRRKGEKIGRGERVFVFILCIHIYIGGEIIERGKSLEIEARCLFFFFARRRLHAVVIAVDLKICQKKNGRSLGREDGLSLASGLLFVICVYFYRSLICRMQLTVKQCRVAKRTTTQETRSLASVYLPQISLSLRYNYWRTRQADLIN